MEQTIIIPPKSGTSFEVKEGQYLKVICPEGEQVADLVAYNVTDLSEFLSNGKTFDYEQTLRLTTGHTLWSNKSRAMLEIIEDTCGIHDFLLSPCCQKTMEIFYNIEEKVPTCHDNLYDALCDYGIAKWSIPTAFNIFMNVPLDPNLSLDVKPPIVRAGDYVSFLAKQDLLIGLTACSAGSSNNFSYKPITFTIADHYREARALRTD